jgi:hypothetical protein
MLFLFNHVSCRFVNNKGMVVERLLGLKHWTRKWRKNAVVRHNSHDPQSGHPKQAYNKS